MQSSAVRAHRAHLRRYWINPRRRRFWVVLAVSLYALAGFVALPWTAHRVAESMVAERYSRDLAIGHVGLNPFALSLEVRDLALRDQDGAELVSFDRLFVDFTLASAWEGAWTFEAVRLDGLSVREERFASGTTRFAVLADQLTGPAPAGPAPAETPEDAAGGGPPPVLVRELRLRDARIRFRDRVPAEPVAFRVEPIDIRVHRLDTRPDASGVTQVQLALGAGGTATWQGRTQLVPPRSTGRVTLDGIVLDPLLPYLQQAAAIRDFGATLDVAFDYTVGLAESGPLIEVRGLEAALRDLAVAAFDPETEFLAADAIRIAGLSYAGDERRLEIGELAIDEPALRTWLTADGTPALLGLLPERPATAAAGESDDQAENNGGADAAGRDGTGDADGAFALRLDAFRLNGLDADLGDRSIEPAGELGVRDLDLALDGFALAPGTRFGARLDGGLASGGTVTFDGDVQIRPALDLAGDLRVRGLALAPAEPYIRQFARVRLEGGALGLAGRLASGPGERLAYDGDFRIEGLDVRSGATGDALLGWRSLGIERVELALDAGRVKTSVIRLERPFARVAIAEDRGTNLGRLRVERDGAAAPAGGGPDADGAGPALDFTIGGVAVADGGLDFSDRSLPLPFDTRVEALRGRISTLASRSAEPATVELEGEVGDHGLARIDGSINALQPLAHTDIGMEFRNLGMPDYSPYTAEFAGRRIAGGRMNLDLAYRIDDGMLEAGNRIVLTDLELGDKVDNPDALDLPLGLAVALLKDGDGVIDIDLPVAGNVNAPEFRIGGVIADALATLLKKIVTSPFRLLGSLVGLDSGELDRVEFLPGRTDLTPPQRERVDKLAQALTKRPALVLVVAGTYAPGLDRPALQRQRAEAALRERMAAAGAETDGVALTDERAREALEALFTEAYPETPLADLRERFTRVPAGLSEEAAADAAPEFDPVAYRAHLARQVIAAQPVEIAALEDLAGARAAAVRERLTAGEAAIAPGRVRVAAPVERGGAEGERVALELDVDVP